MAVVPADLAILFFQLTSLGAVFWKGVSYWNDNGVAGDTYEMPLWWVLQVEAP
jgi:hypothetical protein